jgi:DNA helicase HerA-like ATPase
VNFRATDKIAILGTTGCGKTILSRTIQSAWPKQVIIDPMSEFSDGEIFSDFSAFSKRMVELKKENAKKFRLIFRFNPETTAADEAVFNGILRVCYYFGKIQIIIEEVQLLTTTSYIPDFLKNCLFRGRHEGISMIFVTQRPGQLNKNILSQCQHVFAGQLHDRNDLNYISNFLGEAADKLSNLTPGKFIYFTPGKPTTIVDNGFKK